MSNQCKNEVNVNTQVVMDVMFAAIGIQPTKSQWERAGLVLDETIKITIKMAQDAERQLFMSEQKILSRN